MKKKAVNLIFTVLLVIIIFINTPLWFPIRSYLVMFPHSNTQKRDSLLNKYSINFDIPGGISTKNKDWYPFVMVFNDNEGFSRYLDQNLSLTILYNFGQFNFNDGSSSYYDPSSKYYSSFYGGYLVKNNEDNKSHFGFYNNGIVNLEEIKAVPKYDQEQLVISSLGCPKENLKFDVLVNDIDYNVNYINYNDWVKIDATILTNSPIHRFTKNHTAYIQYGKPIEKFCENEDFFNIILKGRIYGRYFEKYDISAFLYVITPHMSTIEECDKNILSKTVLN